MKLNTNRRLKEILLELTPKQRMALKLLVYHPQLTYTEIADHVGVEHSTFNHWRRRNDLFIEAYEIFLADNVASIEKEFKRNLDSVHNTILGIILDEEATDRDRLNASKFYLEQVLGRATTRHEVDNKITMDKETATEDILSAFEALQGNEEREENEDEEENEK